MKGSKKLTEGNVAKQLVFFALPYLCSCFLQTLYGIVDLAVVGAYNGKTTTSAVANGSQVTHMLTVIIAGLVMGVTVRVGQNMGAGELKKIKKTLGASIRAFSVFTTIITIVLVVCSYNIVLLVQIPKEAVQETWYYLLICFIGVPFIVIYNYISGVFRGMGDSKRPMLFVMVACGINVVLDFALVGGLGLGAVGAALATVLGQAVSVLISIIAFLKHPVLGKLKKEDIVKDKEENGFIWKVGIPISMQDGFIQIAFISISVIANWRGLDTSAAVGIVEKIIGFLFLVPSAYLAAISAFTAQNAGAGKIERARKALAIGICITVGWGVICTIFGQMFPEYFVGMFTKDSDVRMLGAGYFMAYVIDVILASVHFCFSGYFCGNQKAGISFFHNMVSILLIRVPGAFLAWKLWPKNLYPMGLAAPIGSLISALICVGFFVYELKQEKKVRIS
ncbi:MAG: MATE family efflux transporter [Lachnospiraceae bacterium]|nr:MATE family efflux transporter [Lachnospiraceae bacterium]